MSVYQENFFSRGPSPLARATFFSLIAIGVMIADHRFQALDTVRTGVTTVLAPIEAALHWPAVAARSVGGYFVAQERLLTENKELSERLLSLTAQSQRAQLALAEQASLAVLRDAQDRFTADGVIAEIIRDARNPFARKIIVNQGTRQGLRSGLAVIDGLGVVGQVTAVGLNTSEVTLITEKDQAVPVMVVRNGLRAIAVGTGQAGTLELPFNPVAAEIVPGDQLVTSGIDGTYPAGLQVGSVAVVDKNPAFSFARIIALPTAAPNHHRFVRILRREAQASVGTTAGGETTVGPVYPKPDVNVVDHADKGSTKRDTKRGQRLNRDR